MKKFKLIKTFVLIALGILVICFHDVFLKNGGEYLNILIGITMILFAINAILEGLIFGKKNIWVKQALVSLINLIFGIVTIFVPKVCINPLLLTCILWGVWSILNELQEIIVKIASHIKTAPLISIVNLVESIAVIVFSILLIVEANLHAALVHVIILGIELILEPIWNYLFAFEISLLSYIKNKK